MKLNFSEQTGVEKNNDGRMTILYVPTENAFARSAPVGGFTHERTVTLVTTLLIIDSNQSKYHNIYKYEHKYRCIIRTYMHAHTCMHACTHVCCFNFDAFAQGIDFESIGDKFSSSEQTRIQCWAAAQVSNRQQTKCLLTKPTELPRIK